MIEVNLVGNPNTGKTTLFNTLTASHEHVGNWHGVTVEEKVKVYKYDDKAIKLVDLPGTYSLTPLSYEEGVARDYIEKDDKCLIVNICDVNNLQRNLYLTLGLMERGCPVILALNCMDKRPKVKYDIGKLSKLLGIEIVQLNASKKKDCKALNEAILRADKTISPKYNLPYLKNIDFSSLGLNATDGRISIYQKIKLLEDDEFIKEQLKIDRTFGGVEQVAKARYDYIDSLVKQTCKSCGEVYGKSKLDKILLNRFLALPIFLGFIFLSFYLTFFSIGGYLRDGLAWLIDKILASPIKGLCQSAFGVDSLWTGLICDGLIGGISAIISFLPQVALLFFFLSLLEDSGYLSRVAFVFEDILGKIGLSGKSVYTLLMGFGCSTTAVLTARNMEDKNAKIKTALLTPFMSCSAKFPIYAVIGGAFFGSANIWVIIGLYLLGVVIAIGMSCLLEKTVLKSKAQSFILEFPPYRLTSPKRIVTLLWQNVKLFVVRVGTLIVATNIVIFILSNFAFPFRYIGASGGVSMLESLGRIISPIFTPLGFSGWAIASALIAGLVAKEVIVSSVALFNGTTTDLSLKQSLMIASSPVFFASKASALSFLVFALLYFPCLATFSVLLKEIGKKWTFIGVILEFTLAYLVSFIVYTYARAIENIGLLKAMLILFALIMVVWAVCAITNRVKHSRCSGCGKNCAHRKKL